VTDFLTNLITKLNELFLSMKSEDDLSFLKIIDQLKNDACGENMTASVLNLVQKSIKKYGQFDVSL